MTIKTEFIREESEERWQQLQRLGYSVTTDYPPEGERYGYFWAMYNFTLEPFVVFMCEGQEGRKYVPWLELFRDEQTYTPTHKPNFPEDFLGFLTKNGQYMKAEIPWDEFGELKGES